MKICFTAITLVVLTLSLWAESKQESGKPQGELIFLRDFGTDEVGYLAIPDRKPDAGIVVAHGKFGLNTDMRLLCDCLARSGNIVLAVDLFNGSMPTNPDNMAKILSGSSSDVSVAAIKTGINFFKMSPRFKMEKVIVLGVGESTRDVLAAARESKEISGLTLIEPKVLPNAELMNQLGVPVLAFVSSERNVTIDVDQINQKSDNLLTMTLMPQVIHDDMQAFKRYINDRVWDEAINYWRELKVNERSIADRLIDTVF